MMQLLLTAATVLCLSVLVLCLPQDGVVSNRDVNSNGKRSFVVDRSTFLKDGQPFNYVSGTIHYFRVPYQLWDDRLKKLRASGANAVETYIEWFSHEPEPGDYHFDGDNDLPHFIELAQANDLLVILRPGPFIDAERDFGGLPYWLLRENRNMKLRTSDPSFIQFVHRWYSVVLPRLKPLLYHNGGPIITVQVENEYGSFGCDHIYMEKIRDIIREFLGPEVVLFTVDGYGDQQLSCGKTDGVYASVDFGTGVDVNYAFSQQRKHDPTAPLMNNEFYPGWLDHWFEPHHTIKTEDYVRSLDQILARNASVNMYVFHGGTSFGFMAGSNGGPNDFSVCPTSYDYDAPISEAGDITGKYLKIKEVIGKYFPQPALPVPRSSPKSAFGRVNIDCYLIDIFEFSTAYSKKFTGENPWTFEAASQPNGFLLYTTVIDFQPTDPAVLQVAGLKDRALVFLNQKPVGALSREMRVLHMPIQAKRGDTLQLLVENQGRLCFGNLINEHKGITGSVLLGPVTLKHWETSTIPLHRQQPVRELRQMNCQKEQSSFRPSFFRGSFTVNNPVHDTFLKLDGWQKGHVFINGFNVGRYWPIAGPQQTLYVPNVLIKGNGQENDILIFELESSPAPEGRSVEFVDYHIINSTVPLRNKSEQ